MEYQQKPWLKVAAYGLGVLVGAVIFEYKFGGEGWGSRLLARVRNTRYMDVVMHFVGVALILTVICCYYPLGKHREDDIKVPSAFLFTFSQIILPLGMILNILPILLNKSEGLRRFFSITFFSVVSKLFVTCVLLIGSWNLYVFYSFPLGVYSDFKIGVMVSVVMGVTALFLSFLLNLLVIVPFKNFITFYLTGENTFFKPEAPAPQKPMLISTYHQNLPSDSES